MLAQPRSLVVAVGPSVLLGPSLVVVSLGVAPSSPPQVSTEASVAEEEGPSLAGASL